MNKLIDSNKVWRLIDKTIAKYKIIIMLLNKNGLMI